MALAGAVVGQTDHDNIDAGRPLSFDDAEAVSLGSFALELGVNTSLNRNQRFGFEIPAELIYGIFLDTQLEIGVAPRFGRAFQEEGLDAFEIGLLHSFRREVRNMPALALKVEAEVPARAGDTASYRLRGIISKTAQQYDRWHLNLDVDWKPGAPANENKTRLGAVLGYSKPLGYPRHFDTTGVAEIALRQSEFKGQGPVLSLGLGIRRQMTPQSVFDIGIQSDVVAPRGSNSAPLKLIVGYSTSF